MTSTLPSSRPSYLSAFLLMSSMPSSVAACVYYLLKCLVDPELPANAGAYRAVDVKTRPGTVLEAQFPAAVCNATVTIPVVPHDTDHLNRFKQFDLRLNKQMRLSNVRVNAMIFDAATGNIVAITASGGVAPYSF